MRINGESGGKRLVHLDFLRMIAIYLVMFNHSGNWEFFLFAETENWLLKWIYLMMSIFCTVAVPVFFMISGALLLGKEESYRVVYRKRILKFAVVILAASLLYWQYFNIEHGYGINFRECLIRIYSEPWSGQLWYLYSYIGLLTMLPILRKLANAMEDRDYIYLAMMYLLFNGILPILEYLLGDGKVTLYSGIQGALFVSSNLVFFLMGHFLENRLPQTKVGKGAILGGCLLSVASLLICGALTLLRGKEMGYISEWESQKFHGCLNLIPAVTLYLTVKRGFRDCALPAWLEKGIITLGGTTFGIYLLEAILRDQSTLIYEWTKPLLGSMLACMLWIACAMLAGAVLVYFLKKIPVLRDYI